MAKNVRNFVNRAFMRTVDLDLLQELLAPYAAEMEFDWTTLPADEAARRDALFVLFKDGGEDFPDALLDALHCILTLSTPNGARALQEIADMKGLALVPESELAAPGDGKHLTPRHLALRAYLRHPGIFERAVHRLAFFAPSPLRLVGSRRGVVVLNEHAAAQDAFKAACSAFFANRYLGRICEVHWYPEAGLINVLIEHGMNAVTTTVEEEGEQKVKTIREMTLDAISFDPKTGHIKVNARSLVERRELVRLFATHLLADPEFFAAPGSDRLYTLAPIRARGAQWKFKNDWDEDLKEIFVKQVDVDEAEEGHIGRGGSPWALSMRDTENALARLYEMVPEIDLAVLRIETIKLLLRFEVDGRKRDVLVTIRPNNVASFRDHMFEARIFQHLRENGFVQSPPALPAVASAA